MSVSEIADDLRVIGGVEFQQRGIMRRDRMQKGERDVGVAIVVRGLGIDGEYESAAVLWFRCRQSRVLSESRESRRKRPRSHALPHRHLLPKKCAEIAVSGPAQTANARIDRTAAVSAAVSLQCPR